MMSAYLWIGCKPWTEVVIPRVFYPVPPKQRGGSAASRVPVAIPQSKVPSPVQSAVIPTVKFESIVEGQPTADETTTRDENLTQTTSSLNIPKFAVE